MPATDDGFERVYTMNDYWDGPLTGIADFRGQPHVYDRPFDEPSDDYVGWFQLRPVDEETLRIALEKWEIWLRWEDAYRAGQVDISTHPALPAERDRHSELNAMYEARVAALPPARLRAHGDFRAMPGHPDGGRGRWTEVRWRVVTD